MELEIKIDELVSFATNKPNLKRLFRLKWKTSPYSRIYYKGVLRFRWKLTFCKTRKEASSEFRFMRICSHVASF